MRRAPFEQPPPLALAGLGCPSLPRHAAASRRTAAAVHGYPLINGHVPSCTLPLGFHARGCDGWEISRAALGPDDLVQTADGCDVTGHVRTAVDCARTLPLYESVAILDWVLNRGLVSLIDLQTAAGKARGPGSGALQRAVRLSDRRAESAQESVARVGLRAVGIPCQPQFALLDGPFEHHFDLGLDWARVVVDLQSKAHHSLWNAVERDIGYLQLVNVTPGWKLALSVPSMVLPRPTRFVEAVKDIGVRQPGVRCRALRRRYVDADGDLRRDTMARDEARFIR